MNDVTITLKNYRCFEDRHPASITVGRGFTAFVGPNNSGKSSFLRFFYEMRPLLSQLRRTDSNFKGMFGHRIGIGALGVSDPLEFACDGNDREINIGFQMPEETGSIGLYFNASREPLPQWNAVAKRGMNVDIPQDGNGGLLDDHRLDPLFDAVTALTSVLYVGPFRNAINQGASNYFDLSIGSSFVEMWGNWKTGPTKLMNLRVEEVSEDIRKIFGFDRLEINASHDKQTLQVNVDGKPYKLGEHGAGLAQFIVVLGNAAIARPAFVLIDEPELNLHPTLQKDFLLRLASYATHGVVFATHSLGLARSVADRVYSFQRKGAAALVHEFAATPNYAEFLGELSFAAYKELGFETVLLVEGPTDVRTFQQFLRLYGRDQKVVVLPLGGNSMAKGGMEHELGELRRISNSVVAVVDSERTVAGGPPLPERAAFAESCRKWGFKVLITERRATENYFTDSAVLSEMGFPGLAPFEDTPKQPGRSWRKTDNWRVAALMTRADLDQTDVGQFLAAL